MERAVLVIEDDQGSRDALRTLLEGEGYSVSCARDGDEALRKLRDGVRPGVILLDLRMRGLSGADFRAQQLREPAVAKVPVVIFSGAGNGAQASERLGASGYVSKPIDVDVLLKVVGRFFPQEPH